MQKEFYTLAEIAGVIGAELHGDPDCKIYSVAPIGSAQQGQITFLVGSRYQLMTSTRYEKMLPSTQASAVVLAPANASQCLVNKLVIDDPQKGYVKLAQLFVKNQKPPEGIHPTAIIGVNTSIDSSASIGAHCVIGDHCVIGRNSCIEANTVIQHNVIIGADTHIFANVAIYDDVKIGDRVVIHAGAVIGAEGFGMYRDAQGWKKIPHLGSVLIGNDVEVGANTTIDRGSIEDTVLEDGVKLDNLIMIGHGVSIGENTVIAGCVGIGGSTRIGKNCMVGGATGISDNVVIGDNVIFTGMSQVTKSIIKPGIYSSGTSILPQKAWHKTTARLHSLDELARKLKKLEKNNNE